MRLFLWARGIGTSPTNRAGLWALVILLLFDNVAAKVQFVATHREFRVTEGSNFTIQAGFEVDPGDTLDSASWTKMNGVSEMIVDCLLDRVVTSTYPKYSLRATCTLHRGVAALALTSLTPTDTGRYKLKVVLENGDFNTTDFMGKLYEPISKVSIESHPANIGQGTDLTLTCKVANGTDPIFNWTVDQSSKYVISANGSVLTIPHFQLSDCRSCGCLVKNDIDQKRMNFNISGEDSPLCKGGEQKKTRLRFLLVLPVLIIITIVIVVTAYFSIKRWFGLRPTLTSTHLGYRRGGTCSESQDVPTYRCSSTSGMGPAVPIVHPEHFELVQRISIGSSVSQNPQAEQNQS